MAWTVFQPADARLSSSPAVCICIHSRHRSKRKNQSPCSLGTNHRQHCVTRVERTYYHPWLSWIHTPEERVLK